VSLAADYGWLKDQGKDASLLFFAQIALAMFPDTKVAGLAVSGGSDSMAMLHLMARVARHAGRRIEAVTVDHALRAESADEAAFVGRICAKLSVPHAVQTWDHGAVAGNMMDAARRARYGLIAGWAQTRGIGHVAVAHTADDQAETFLMGLSRAAGLDGLSGMRHHWNEGGVVFRRPFLHHSRAELRDYLIRHGLEWIDDPTNDNDKYTRTKARKVLRALKPLGITVDRLLTVTSNLAMAQGAVKEAVAHAAQAVAREVAGAMILDRAEFGSLGPEVGRRLLIGALLWVSGAGYPPREAAVRRLEQAIRDGRDATLSGCRIRMGETTVRILREPKTVAVAETPTIAVWDHRWHLDGPHADGLTIRALGDGLGQIPNWRDTGHPRDALIVTPAVWRGDALIAAPVAGFAQGWTATLRPAFASFLLSH
jgi:tRNA(Ile)-lysidine synthase